MQKGVQKYQNHHFCAKSPLLSLLSILTDSNGGELVSGSELSSAEGGILVIHYPREGESWRKVGFLVRLLVVIAQSGKSEESGDSWCPRAREEQGGQGIGLIRENPV